MPCYELAVSEKPPETPQEQAERLLIILVVGLVAVFLLKVVS